MNAISQDVKPGAQIRTVPNANGKVAQTARIWIDLDNTPHVPFFIPIARELQRRGHHVFFTARDAFQVCELADRAGLPYRRIGRHYGKNMLMKGWGLAWRSLQLGPIALKERPTLALSHGARSQILLSNLLGIPTVLIADYEHAEAPMGCHPRWEIVPEALRNVRLHSKSDRVRYYSGLKEDVYAPSFRPDSSIMEELGLKGPSIIVTVRPPANEAHYYNPESDRLFHEFMDYATSTPNVRSILLPRNQRQSEMIRATHPAWFAEGKTIIPARAVDGLNLVWHSDLVVSGGGTMNREAAALGIPVYSIFRGKTGALDSKLEEEGRLVMVRSVAEVRQKISLRRRDPRTEHAHACRPALRQIVDHVEAVLAVEARRE